MTSPPQPVAWATLGGARVTAVFVPAGPYPHHIEHWRWTCDACDATDDSIHRDIALHQAVQHAHRCTALPRT